MAQDQFNKKFGDRVLGTLSGFDRVLLKGMLRLLSQAAGLAYWLKTKGVARREFLGWAEGLSKQLRSHAVELAELAGRPYRYLNSAKIKKEDIAQQIVAREGIREGLVCVLATLESCQTYKIAWNTQGQLVRCWRKCLFLYFYMVHPEMGLLHVRLQTWFPFDLQVCLNGREWLARQMDREGLKYERLENCFAWLPDPCEPRRWRMNRWRFIGNGK
jgi:hypothetical protein